MADRDAATLPTGTEKVRAVREMFDAISPRYDLVNRVMTFGMDRGWRRRAIRDLQLTRGSLVVDLAAGTGDLCRELEAAGHHAVGVDMSAGMLDHARTTAPLVQGDCLSLPHPDGSLDGAVSGFALRNFTDLGTFFTEVGRVLRPRGRMSLLDVAQPEHALLRWGHGIYFGGIVPRIGAVLGSSAAAYRYLPKSVAYLPPPDEMLELAAKAGFVEVRRVLLSGGITQLITGTRA